MLSFKTLAALGLLLHGVNGGGKAHYVDTTVTNTITQNIVHPVDVTVYHTKTDIKTICVTEYTTTTLHYTVSTTQTNSATVTATKTDSTTLTDTDYATITYTKTDVVTVTNTDTDWVTVTYTGTDYTTVTTTGTAATTVTTTGTAPTTVTTTGTVATTVTTTGTVPTTVTTTDTVPATITTFTTQVQTIFSTTYDPCPKSCSISADTVSVYFWPTNRPYTYPTTHVDEKMGYTFTSPSVYLFIPTARGINTAGQPAGPSTASWMLPLDLYQVSTIAPGNITRQLTLADLGTDCPKTVDPTAIATLDAACNPVLAAPTPVRSWAYPCNACGRFGLFDPPYAVPTLPGNLVVPTTTVPPPPPVTVTAAPTPAPTAPPAPPAPGTGVIFIVYHDGEGQPLGTATVTAPGVSGSVTSSVTVPATCEVNTSTRVSLTSSVASATSTPATAAGVPRYGAGQGVARWVAPVVGLLML
ncbi:hypothetical protein QBC34DRAFT_443336 [Podospora aff. communis PSN243]|uniref:Uncharacterized protein n=1 Tax=Podospora aff. communis PSN243 TaxID=3040156 RepID=A0AAV9G4W0_9PEZI|nr:hypothetical protein QBC34DRAFT_443336 [Podospora aff. communis PSN243]